MIPLLFNYLSSIKLVREEPVAEEADSPATSSPLSLQKSPAKQAQRKKLSAHERKLLKKKQQNKESGLDSNEVEETNEEANEETNEDNEEDHSDTEETTNALKPVQYKRGIFISKLYLNFIPK